MAKIKYKNDAEECAAKIEQLLREYGCCLTDLSGLKWIRVVDTETNDAVEIENNY